MGLLDNLDFNDPKTMGLLNLGLGILAGNTGRPGDMGQGLMGGLSNYQQMMQAQQQAALRKQQQDMQTEQFGWERDKYQREANAPIKVGNALLDPKTYQPIYAAPEDANKYGMQPRIGINPQTGKPEYVQFGGAGDSKFTGVAPSQDEIAIAEAQDKGVLPPGYPYAIGGGNQQPQPVMPFTWSGPTATDIKEGTSPDMVLRDPARPNLPPASQRKIAEKKAESQIMSPLDQANFDEKKRDAAEYSKKKTGQANLSIKKANIVIGHVDEALGKIGQSTAGGIGGALQESPIASSIVDSLGGGNAYDLNKTIKTIKSNIGFSELQAMRDASPTGGALGAIAVQELEALQSTISSLDQSQSPSQLRDNLLKVRTHFENWKKTVSGQSPVGTSPAGNQALPLPSNPSAKTLKKGTVYQTPKGTLRWNGMQFEDVE